MKLTLPIMNEETTIAPEIDKVPHLERYDEAMKELLKQVFAGDVIFSPAEEFFKNYQRTENNIKLPALSVFPQPTYQINEQNSFASYNVGHKFKAKMPVVDVNTNEVKDESIYMSKNIQALYITSEYEIAVWSTLRSEALQCIQELMFWLYNQQEVKITYFGEELILSLEPPKSFDDDTDYSFEGAGRLYTYSCNCIVHACIYKSKNYFNTIESKNYVKED